MTCYYKGLFTRASITGEPGITRDIAAVPVFPPLLLQIFSTKALEFG